ncbi:MAG TPA: hypothetical protein VN429_02665 [Methanospirillum sp.]|uniref:hypothetical protein n=1 Tax=Methanospirillum sp. TaxID=45200 RepID=UPI002D095536|nr:hypothetical protein [Methanospirillum sp.]HWQ63292.1 hypothetical protein [Methanospirillum sp.]
MRPSDFCEIDRGSERVHCQERIPIERLSVPLRMNRKIYRSCFEKAKRDKAGSFRSLPGVIDSASLVRLTLDLGRCQVCDTFKAT